MKRFMPYVFFLFAFVLSAEARAGSTEILLNEFKSENIILDQPNFFSQGYGREKVFEAFGFDIPAHFDRDWETEKRHKA